MASTPCTRANFFNGAAGALIFAMLSGSAWAQSTSEDIEFRLDRDNFSFGREVPLRYDFSCDDRFLGPVEIRDDGAGQLSFEVGEAYLGLPIIPTCTPVSDPSWNLKDIFELSPGDYTLTVRQPGGDQVFNFAVRDSVLDIGAAQTGAWFDPAQSGQGLNPEFFPDGRAIGYWYAYDADGDNLWLFGDGRYDGDEAVFDVFEADGEGFPPNYNPESHGLEPWGDMTLVLDTCRAGTLSWTTSSEDFEDGSMPLQRISPANGHPCIDDDLDADGWRTVNLLAEDPELDFELLNASFDGSGEGGDWALAFEDLPAALGEGRALVARPVSTEELERFYLGTAVRSGSRTEIDNSGLEPPYALTAEITIAVTGQAACADSEFNGVAVTFMGSAWDSRSEASQEPLTQVPSDYQQTQLLGHIDTLRREDCTTVDEFLVRTFVTPAVTADVNIRWATLTFASFNFDPDSDEEAEGPVYLLDFQVRGRGIEP